MEASRAPGGVPTTPRPNGGGREPPAAIQRALSLLLAGCAIVATAALAVLGVRAALRLEPRWDAWAYHLPFAAALAGLDIPFEMNEVLRYRFQGFPPLPQWFEGVLWRLTGRVEATGVACFLAFVAFLAYCARSLRARFGVVALVALTAPLVVIHTATNYVDLFGNSLLAIGVATCLALHLYPDRATPAILVAGLAGLAGAAWSKFQLVPLVALFFVLLAFVTWRGRRTLRLDGRALALAFAVAAALASAPYVRNWVAYGNPFWPVRVPVFASHFPYKEDAIADGIARERPPPLADYGRLRLFAHSLLEIDHPTRYEYRPRWIVDQGSAFIAFRMGGFWGVGVVFFLLSTLGMLIACRGWAGAATGAAIAAVFLFVGLLPQSNELRYYLFVPLAWAAALGLLFDEFRAAMPRAALAFLATTVVLFGYMVSENRFHYTVQRVDYRANAVAWKAAPWWPRLRPGITYCSVGVGPNAMMLTGPTMREFTIVDRKDEAACPEGSTVLDAQGAMRPRREPPPPSAGAGSAEASRAVAKVIESATLFQAGSFEASVAAAREALALDPRLADAHNNLCAAQNALGRWDEAIAACKRALQLQPEFGLAGNNLAWAESMKAKAAAEGAQRR